MQIKKYLNLCKCAVNLVLKKKVLNSYPVDLTVEPTNRCNMKCKICPRSQSNRESIDMNFSKYCQLVNQVKDYIKAIRFIGIGEPLLHPQIVDMIEYAKTCGLRTYLVSNGSLLNTNMAQQLITVGLDEISISIDGFSKSYASIRSNNYFQQTVDNIIHLSNIRKDEQLKIDVNMVACPENKHEVKEFINFWQPKVNYITIKKFHNFGGHVNNKDTHYKRINTCQAPWSSTLILSNGEAVPCCGDIEGSFSYGNVFEKQFSQVWNSEVAQEIRHINAKKKFDNNLICCTCNMRDISIWQGNFFVRLYHYFFTHRNLQGISDYKI